ncbi:MAG: TonB family protein, partial [Pyrinomonadaceae bacterium]
PARGATADRPPDAKAEPAPPATRPDNDKPNVQTATPSPNSTTAAATTNAPAKTAADANAKESQPVQSRQPAAPQPQPSTSPQTSESPQKLVVAGGVLNSRAKSLPVPVYPETARKMRVAGTVVVAVTVDESGRVLEARAASGPAMLRQAAVDAARRALFQPPLVGGQPARLTGVINYTFTL